MSANIRTLTLRLLGSQEFRCLIVHLTSFSSPLQSNRKENKGGYLCHSCAEQRVGPLAFLTASPEQVHAMERTVENIVLPRHEALLFLVF